VEPGTVTSGSEPDSSPDAPLEFSASIGTSVADVLVPAVPVPERTRARESERLRVIQAPDPPLRPEEVEPPSLFDESAVCGLPGRSRILGAGDDSDSSVTLGKYPASSGSDPR
jgi:hypothetical protein